MLALGELAGEKPPDLAPARLRLMGQKLLRRLVDGWARLPQALEQYRAALVAHGHKSRTIDVFGTLLACADLLLTDDDVDSDSAGELAELLDIAALPEADDDASDQQRWLNFLMTCVIPLDGAGTKNTVAEWIRQATVDHNSLDVAEANRILGNYGMKVLRLKLADGNQAPLFAIANQHTGLDRLHAGTHWAGRSGTMGVWVQAARDIDGAEKYGTLRFNSAPVKCTVIPLGQVLPKPAAHEAEAPSHAQLPV